MIRLEGSPHRRLRLLALFGALSVVAPWGASLEPSAVQARSMYNRLIDFDREIRPILSENCFACHGPDDRQRKAELRLDTQEGAFRDPAILSPGHPERSKLLDRLTATDPKEHMPPPRSGKALKPDQIDLIRKWIEQGAHWSEHWAFLPPKRPPLPEVKNPGWARNSIDRFVLARLDLEYTIADPVLALIAQECTATLARPWLGQG